MAKQTNKRLEALNALADIRDALRHVNGGYLYPEMVAQFNQVATYLGADPDWCTANYRVD